MWRLSKFVTVRMPGGIHSAPRICSQFLVRPKAQEHGGGVGQLFAAGRLTLPVLKTGQSATVIPIRVLNRANPLEHRSAS